MTTRELTAKAHRCSDSCCCPGVHALPDGQLAIIGAVSGVTPNVRAKVGNGEAAVRISRELLLDSILEDEGLRTELMARMASKKRRKAA